jgi:hypothetical protein
MRTDPRTFLRVISGHFRVWCQLLVFELAPVIMVPGANMKTEVCKRKKSSPTRTAQSLKLELSGLKLEAYGNHLLWPV